MSDRDYEMIPEQNPPPTTDRHGCVYLTDGFISTLNMRLDRLESKLDWLHWKLTFVPPTEPIRSQMEGNRIVGIRMLPHESPPWPGDLVPTGEKEKP